MNLEQPYEHTPTERVVVAKMPCAVPAIYPSIAYKAPTLGALLDILSELVAANPELSDEGWYGFDDENLYFKNYIIQPS